MRWLISGSRKLTDPSEVPGVNIGKLLLSPTRSYAPVISQVLATYRNDIHGMVHCSGGGQTKILHFIDQLHVIKDNLFAVPPLFSLIREESGTSWEEMYRVFNMGHRFEIYAPKEIASQLISIATGFNVEAKIIGHCVPSPGKSLTISSGQGTYTY